MTELQYHPLANLFPLIEGKDFDEFCAGIKADGILHDKIVLHEEMILDGRNRQRACDVTGITAHYETFNPNIHGADPLNFVIARNLHRRHLTDDQRRMVAAKLATVGRGRPSVNFAEREINRETAAELLSVDVAGVDRAKSIVAHGTDELRHAVEQGDLSVNTGAQIAKKPEEEQHQELVERGIVPGGARSIMSSRHEPDDSLDYFPTPPFATRALFEHVLPHLDFTEVHQVWEPACGEGHMTGVIEEYAKGTVIGTDIFDYSRDGRMPPSWFRTLNFLDEKEEVPVVDWIITNPPFSDKTEQFVLRALGQAEVGVAMFVRLQWLETIGRYETIFRDNPPTLIAFFAERVNLCKGRWDPDGSTATAYIWLVWIRDELPQAPFWIPPGCRDALTRADDRERFTVRPVLGIPRADQFVDVNEKPGLEEVAPARIVNVTIGPSNAFAQILVEGDVPADVIRDKLTELLILDPPVPIERITVVDYFTREPVKFEDPGEVIPSDIGVGPIDEPFDPETGEIIEDGGSNDVALAEDSSTADLEEPADRVEVASRASVGTDDDEGLPTFLTRGHPDNTWLDKAAPKKSERSS